MKSPQLSAHRIEPFVEIHPDDASKHALEDGKLAQISSDTGSKTGAEIFVCIRVTERQQRGSLFVPMHWNLQFSSQARVGSLIKSVVDPISGQPEFKHSVASIKSCDASWYGFIISRQKHVLKYSRYWVRSRGKGFWRYEIAGKEKPENWAKHAKTLLNVEPGEEWAEFYDKADGHYRAARFISGHLDSVIFIDSSVLLPPRDWLLCVKRTLDNSINIATILKMSGIAKIIKEMKANPKGGTFQRSSKGLLTLFRQTTPKR